MDCCVASGGERIVMDASTVPASSVLSEEDLELVVQRYRREMAA